MFFFTDILQWVVAQPMLLNFSPRTTLPLLRWLILAGATINDVQSMVENHLKEMIIKMFDPKKADTIFTEEGEVTKHLTIFISHQHSFNAILYRPLLGLLK